MNKKNRRNGVIIASIALISLILAILSIFKYQAYNFDFNMDSLDKYEMPSLKMNKN